MHNLDIGANAATATRALRRSQSRLLVASAVNSMLASIQTFGDLCSIDRCGLRAVVRCVLRKGPLSIWAIVSLPNDIPWHPICSSSIPLDFAVSLSGTVQTNDSPFPPSARTSGLCAVPAARLPRTYAKEVNYGKTQ